jgi:signal transduction histidine kinase
MRPLSLRTHFVIGAIFWTFGLFGLAIVLWHVVLGNREPPATFFWFVHHAHFFGLLCIACLVAGVVQIRRGWRSVSQIRARLAALHATPGRRLEGVYPSEIAPLVADLNQLLEQRDVMVEQARATAGDLAHGLKTPLAVITQEAERARRDGHAELAGALFEQVGRMRRQVDAHLARSRVDLSKHRVLTPIVASDAVAGVVRTLSQLYAERGLAFAVNADPALNVLVAREDLDELVGNLLDNACKWARTRCSVTVRQAGGRVAVIVEDDGPGISAEMRSQVPTRGVRADEAVPGTGLGLAIVRDLTAAYGGKVVLDESPLGGLRARIDVPGA